MEGVAVKQISIIYPNSTVDPYDVNCMSQVVTSVTVPTLNQNEQFFTHLIINPK